MFTLKTLSTIALAALTVPAASLPTLDKRALATADVIANLATLTSKARALQAPAQSLTIVNGPLIVIGQGPFPEIIRGYVDIVSTGTTFINQLEGQTPFSAADSTTISTAYGEFASVNVDTLNILLGKAGLFETVPFIGQPVAAVLRQVENVYDTLSFTLIDNAPTRASNIQARQANLDRVLADTITAYEGIAT